MAVSRLIKVLAATLPCAIAAPWVVGAQSVLQSKAPISLNAENSEVDFKTGMAVWRNVTISQGEVSIRADQAQATGMEFQDSRWEFSGNVKINAESRGSLQSDKAVVEFRNNQILRATVNGTPAAFEQKQTGSENPARGHAKQIVYEVTAGTVKFSNDAWLSNGGIEAKGPLLVYDIRQQKVLGTTAPGNGERIQITIVPKDVEKVSPKPETAPPSGDAGDTPR